jgi:hypothetical protein
MSPKSPAIQESHDAQLRNGLVGKSGSSRRCCRRMFTPDSDSAGSGKYFHFHRSTRSSAHCFYGTAQR